MIRIAMLALAATGAVAVTAPAAMARTSSAAHKAKAPRYENSRPLYNMAPGDAPALGRDTPAGTGGGSTGYNKMLYNC
jgi:hypothetical protein